ncbi:hypothetical protein [Pantoea stewartii]|uniref:hypothetical protein n=1 Tax=Pantoea stewartii TaxID=66269 RepID=UPI0025A087F3|nr:hypothetical protein [Pantoea stewartii]
MIDCRNNAEKEKAAGAAFFFVRRTDVKLRPSTCSPVVEDPLIALAAGVLQGHLQLLRSFSSSLLKSIYPPPLHRFACLQLPVQPQSGVTVPAQHRAAKMFTLSPSYLAVTPSQNLRTVGRVAPSL